ncbi:MAG: GTP-binding protein [Parvibaculum sp.]
MNAPMNAPMNAHTYARTPLTIIGGYLGAGKTTLINALLAGTHGQRLAVIVNDFGSINIDVALIENRDGETISLANGCICCRIADDLATTLIGLTEARGNIDHVLIETSGVAEPQKVATYASALPAFELANIIVLADVETFRARSKDKFVGSLVQRQVKAADILVLTKGDQLDDKTRAEREAEITRGAAATLLTGEQARAEPIQLLTSRRASGPATVKYVTDDHDKIDDHHHNTPFVEQSFTTDLPLDLGKLQRLFSSRPPSVHRAKGILHLSCDLEHRHVLQLVGDRMTISADRLWGDDAPGSQLVVIGSADDPSFDAWSNAIGSYLSA